MTWSISASGTKEEAKAQLAKARQPEHVDEGDQPMRTAALTLLDSFVEVAPGTNVSASASGHTSGGASGQSSISFSSWTPEPTP